MFRQTASALLLALLLTSIVAFSFIIRPVRAQGTIYIRADGSVDPPTAPISTADNYTYIFTGNVFDSIVVQRNGILIEGAGYTVQGDGIGIGIDLSHRTNITLSNMKIESFNYGVYLFMLNNSSLSTMEIASSTWGLYLWSSFNNQISGSNITANLYEGVFVYSSSNNLISENNITANVYEGVYLYSSSNNTISGNNLSLNSWDGVYLDSSSNNIISENNIENNGYGVSSYYSSNDRSFHNNFINNTSQVDTQATTDVWDDGYPSGGNYWSNYTGVDAKCGPSQDHPGGDGIGDTSYTIDTKNTDRYPLMNPWAPPSGHNVAVISVVPSKTVVGQGYSCSITVYGVNRGEYSENFNVTAYTNTTSIASQNVTLTSGNSTTITFTWNTTGFAKGNYTISAYAWPVMDETDTADNNFMDGVIRVSMVGDVTGVGGLWNFVPDGKCDGKDITAVALCFGSHPGSPPPLRWEPNCDITNDGKVDGKDITVVALHYGQHDP